MRSAVARRRHDFETEVEIRGHRLIVDETADDGGGDAGPRPTELLAASLASCTTITLVMYADRKGWDVGAIEVAVDYRTPSVDDGPSFDVNIRIRAPLTDEQRERILTVAAKCPVHKTLNAQKVEVTDSLELIEASRPARVELGLKDRVCVVTGASRGIGLAVSKLLCGEGARVLLIARSERNVIEAADQCMAAGGAAESLACDVTDPDAAERIAAAAEDRFGPTDVLVNNAGQAKWRDLDDVPDEDWQAAWDLNVMAPLRLMRALAPVMSERGWGRIVNVASTAGKRPSAAMAEYSVAKAAELSLSRIYADRHAGDGVLVNAVCPGPTKSEMWMSEGGLLDQSKEHGGHDSRDEALDVAGAKRPIGRLAEVEEIASVIVFLCSEQASYVAGAAWSVDGGTVQVII